MPAPPKVSPAPSSTGRSSQRSSRKKENNEKEEGDGVPKLVKQFEKFHSENGVRTVIGSVGSVHNGVLFAFHLNVTTT